MIFPPIAKSARKLLFLLISFSTVSAMALQINPPEWTRPLKPFHMMGNLYYVGTADLTSYLFVTPKGDILLDVGLPQNVPLVEANIRALGFHLRDIKILLNSHAHFDHAGGLQAMKKATGARLYASRADAALMARGGLRDPGYGDKYPYPPVKADKILQDGEQVTLDGTTLTAHVTAGHTKGCTTWTTELRDHGKTYHAVFVCSTSAPGYRLIHNPAYPNIVSDYQHTFATLRSLPCDVFLGAHGSFFSLLEKVAELKKNPDSNPFIDPAGYRQYLDHSQAAFEAELKQQRAESAHKEN